MVAKSDVYAATLALDYPEKLARVTTAFRMIWVIPIAIVLTILKAQATSTVTVVTTTGQTVAQIYKTGGGIIGALFAATLLMILFRQRYPRWWFDFALQFTRFSARVGAYMAFLTDRYPATEDEQSVHLDIEYPDAERNLNRFTVILGITWGVVIIALGLLMRFSTGADS